MRMSRVLLAVTCLLSAGYAGLSGTYTIKSDGTGDFASLMAAGESLTVLGVSGDCVFELYGDTLGWGFGAGPVAGSDSWSTVFRPGPGEDPVVWGAEFLCGGYHNVKMESLRFAYCPITAHLSEGWRISGCRFLTHDWGVTFEEGASDTVDGNRFEVQPEGSGHDPAIRIVAGTDIVVSNNLLTSESDGIEFALVELDETRNARVVFNTIRRSPADAAYGNCIWVFDEGPCEVRDNIFVLARPAEDMNACVLLTALVMDSIQLDNNCYFVESLGWVGMRDSNPPVWYDWVAWRGFGFEANGINADPMLVSATDLHLRQGSPCIGAGMPIAGVEFDIDGDPRDPVHPDIGADEFTGGGIEETPSAELRTTNGGPTILSGSMVHCLESMVVFDAMGRRVLDPKPGVYFVRERSAVSGERSALHVRKVVIQR